MRNSLIESSGNLFHKMNNTNMKNKPLPSLDIKSLYTLVYYSIPVSKSIKLLENELKKTNAIL